MPQRIHFDRFAGKPLPPNTRLVTRPGKWGNPFRIDGGDGDRERAVELFRDWLLAEDQADARAMIRRELRGFNLACVCPLDGRPCHADVLLEIAASEEAAT